jgi:hypothetical protein
MISKVHFPKFRVGEVLQFLYGTLTLCQDHDPEKLKILALINALSESTTKLDEVYKVAQGSALTVEVINLDQQRDKCITGIKKCADSYTYHFDPTVCQAATLILQSIESHGSEIPKQNLQAETATLNDMLGNWTSKPELAAAITKLALGSWADELKRLNDSLQNTYLSRVKEASEKPDEKTIEQRKIAIEAYRELTSAIDAHATLATDAAYNTLTKELNALVYKYNLLVDNRGGDDDNKEDPPKTA